ncbi:hypothetical protein HDF18_26410 [Mucilaginibacter sp. X5P1]|uniref:hypothetical protein n=1 Tax=Mucilaginibacter sp. X5P1 TaxID=2723088 RepID=UPI0016140EFC|nr:hypothetical protein [Mucilaginibacter sp. X5P1]MBB6138609.1 hypothetical protein [Mucilaginibacter sp. X5P1]
MNNIFNPGRFGRLFIKHTTEHYKSYLMSLIVLFGVMLLGASFLVYLIHAPIDLGLQTAMFTSIMLLAGTIFTSTVFADFAENKKAISSLTLPASHFEKYLVAWLYSFVIFLICYLTCFYLVDWLAINARHYPGQQIVMINVFNRYIILCFLMFAFLHAVALWGAIFYNKLHFVKTAFAFFIGIALLTLINKFLLSYLLHKDVLMAPPFGALRIMEHNRELSLFIAENDGGFVIWLLGALALIFWAAAYYRLKEKQV